MSRSLVRWTLCAALVAGLGRIASGDVAWVKKDTGSTTYKGWFIVVEQGAGNGDVSATIIDKKMWHAVAWDPNNASSARLPIALFTNASYADGTRLYVAAETEPETNVLRLTVAGHYHRPQKAAFFKGSTSSTTYVTAVNYTSGGGLLHAISGAASNTALTSVQITVDGGTPVELSLWANERQSNFPAARIDADDPGYYRLHLGLQFNSSLKVEYKVGTGAHYMGVVYSTDRTE